MSSAYRLSRPFAARLAGLGLVVVGVLVLALAALVGVLSLPPLVLSVGVVLAAVAVLVLALVAVRRAVVVRFDDTGYTVRLVRGAGVRRAQWPEVEDVVAAIVGGQRCLVLRLRDGRTTTVPVAVLEGGSEAFVTDLRARLNRGHGYRPVPRRA